MFQRKFSMKVMGYFYIRDHSELFSQVIQKRSFLSGWNFSSNNYQIDRFVNLIDVYIFVVNFFGKLGSVVLNVKTCTQEVTWMKNISEGRGLFFIRDDNRLLVNWVQTNVLFCKILFSLRKNTWFLMIFSNPLTCLVLSLN